MASLGEQAVGSSVFLNVDGTPREFLVVHQGLPGILYDSSCDGTWLLMKALYNKQTFNSSNNNDYENSDLNAYLSDTFFPLFDSDVQRVIKQVKIPYIKGTGSSATLSSGANGLSTKVFLLSRTEIGFEKVTYGLIEGAVLDYFNGATNNTRVAYTLTGTNAQNWWTRSGRVQGTGFYIWNVGSSGGEGYMSAVSSLYTRPAIILPYELAVSDYDFVDGSLAKIKGIAGQVDIGGVLRNLTGEGYIDTGGILRSLVNSCANINGALCSLKDFSKLPSGYTQVKYIQSSGTQYIDTGLTVNKSDSYEYILTAYFTNDAYGGANGYMQFTSGYSQNTLTEFRIVYDGSTGIENIYVNGSLYTTNNWTSTYNGTNVKIGIFKLGDTGNVWHTLDAQIGKVYSCQIYKSGTLVRDFVPCTNPSGVAGLYDLVGGAFYANAGTGTFGVGT